MLSPKRFEQILNRCTPDGDCLIWPGATGGSPRARYAVGQIDAQQRIGSLHRAIYEYIHGTLPVGRKQVIEHTCLRSLCLQPSHLKWVTQAENLSHSPNSLNAINAAKTHCCHGHIFSNENTYISVTNGQRVCRLCKRDWMRAKRARTKSQ